jgi:hypothetical protein
LIDANQRLHRVCLALVDACSRAPRASIASRFACKSAGIDARQACDARARDVRATGRDSSTRVGETSTRGFGGSAARYSCTMC